MWSRPATTAMRLESRWGWEPRVASQARQPWAKCQNPVGIPTGPRVGEGVGSGMGKGAHAKAQRRKGGEADGGRPRAWRVLRLERSGPARALKGRGGPARCGMREMRCARPPRWGGVSLGGGSQGSATLHPGLSPCAALRRGAPCPDGATGESPGWAEERGQPWVDAAMEDPTARRLWRGWEGV